MMNTKFIGLPDIPTLPDANRYQFKATEPVLLFIILLLIWCFVPGWLQQADQTAGSIDQSIWLLVILSLISFLLIVGLCWWLLQHFWKVMGLPDFNFMVLQFNTLSLWQQLSFYWGSFVLLLLAALGCLMAIC